MRDEERGSQRGVRPQCGKSGGQQTAPHQAVPIRARDRPASGRDVAGDRTAGPWSGRQSRGRTRLRGSPPVCFIGSAGAPQPPESLRSGKSWNWRSRNRIRRSTSPKRTRRVSFAKTTPRASAIGSWEIWPFRQISAEFTTNPSPKRYKIEVVSESVADYAGRAAFGSLGSL